MNSTTKQSTVIYTLVGGAVLSAIALFGLLVFHQSGISPLQWGLFALYALVLMLAAFAPSVVRRWQGLPPPQPLSPADIRFSLAVTAILCPLAFFAVWEWGAFGTLVIMLAPIAFMLRSPRRNPQNTNDRKTEVADQNPTGQP
jgi:hypothetical protein